MYIYIFTFFRVWLACIINVLGKYRNHTKIQKSWGSSQKKSNPKSCGTTKHT